jgi:hypothetical protein
VTLSIAEPLVAKSRRAAGQFRAVSRAASILLPLVANTAEHEEFLTIQKELEAGFNALVTIYEDDKFHEAIERLELGISDLERRLQTLDDLIPTSYFREHFDVSQASAVALADYAALLGRFAGDDSARLDRIQYLLTLLLSLFISPEDDSPIRRRQLLAEALPASTTDPTMRETAVAFFRDAMVRLRSFRSLKEFFDSGYFVDVRGYKLSLRQHLLDPEVMTFVIELNEATTQTIERLAVAEKTSDQELEAHLAEVDQRLKAIFSKLRVDDAARTVRLKSWLERAAQARAQGKKPPRVNEVATPARAPVPPSRRNTRPMVLAVIVVVLALVVWVRPDNGQPLRELTPAQCVELSPLLTAGVVAPVDNPKVFIGQVDKSRWALMAQNERDEAARDFAAAVQQKGWFGGTVMLEDRVVIQVENGQVLVIQ